LCHGTRGLCCNQLGLGDRRRCHGVVYHSYRNRQVLEGRHWTAQCSHESHDQNQSPLTDIRRNSFEVEMRETLLTDETTTPAAAAAAAGTTTATTTPI